jgi:SAM-dependent methyltransferase
MNAPALAELATVKQGARATWAAGDYHAIAVRQLWSVGPKVVARAGVTAGEDVLDAACGTGNAALRAAQAGARVTGVDLTPELFETGRALASEYGVEVRWLQGDVEELPLEDESFDAVLSVFGCMFAPRHAIAAAELARVLRPGGRMVLASWTPDGAMGDFFKTVASYLPPPPTVAQPPALWGLEAHVRGLFEGSGVELEFERDMVEPPRFESPRAGLEFLSSRFGPLMMARQLTEASGRWEELREELIALYEQGEPAEYLITIGRKGER